MPANIEDFLSKIAQLESSGGKNTEHKKSTYGVQKGDTAIGTYGLMPKTIDEIANRTQDPELLKLKAMSEDEKRAYMAQNPEVEKQAAHALATFVLDKQGGDEQKAAYSWLYGHNMSPEKIEKRNYQKEPYVEKFNKLQKQMYPMSIEGTPEAEPLKKYIEGAPSLQEEAEAQDKMRKQAIFQKMMDNRSRAIDISAAGPKNPEEEALMNENLDPISQGIMHGGMVGGIANIAKAAPEMAAPVIKQAFPRLKSLFETGTGKVINAENTAEALAKLPQSPYGKLLIKK